MPPQDPIHLDDLPLLRESFEKPGVNDIVPSACIVTAHNLVQKTNASNHRTTMDDSCVFSTKVHRNTIGISHVFPPKWIGRKLLPLFVFWFVLVILPSSALGNENKNVLILNSYHRGFKWTDSQVSAAKQVLLEKSKNIELYIEYMDTKRIYTDEYIKRLNRLFQLKFANVNFDVIITTDDNALKFVMKYHKELFAEAPVSFCGINDYQESMFVDKKEFTGLVEVLDIKPTIDLAMKLHPRTRRVVVVVDDTPTGMGQRKDVAAVAGLYEDLKFEYLKGEDLSNAELLERLRALPPDSVVLLTVWLRDKNAIYMPPYEGGPLISANSATPVYGIIDMFLGHGIVGGKLLNSRIHGRTAAEMALRILDGEKPVDIPVLIKSTNPYMFDYRQLERWGISLTDLPEESLVINKPFSVYEEYKRTIWSIGLIIVLLCSVVAILVGNILLRKQAERKLRESEEKFRKLFEESNDAVFIHDFSGKILDVNHRACEMIGYNRDALLQIDITALHPEEELPNYEKAFQTCREEGSARFGSRLMNADGTEIYVDISSRVIDVKQGAIQGIVRDITESKRAEKALLESEEKYRELVENANSAILRMDPEGRITFFNEYAQRFFGYSEAEILGRHVVGTVVPEIDTAGKDLRLMVEKVLEQSDDYIHIENKNVCRDGKRVWVQWANKAIVDEDGNLRELLCVGTDVTERRRAEEEKAKLAEQLRQAQKMEAIGTLAGGIAHDFNNILGIIVGNIELSMNDVPEWNPARYNLEEVRKASLRARDMVRQILSFSRQTDQIAKPIRISPILEESLKLLRSSIPTTIEIRQNFSIHADTILGDPTQIKQILMNLCANAAHAMQEKGGIMEVSLKNIDLDEKNVTRYHDLTPGKYLTLSVSDTGHGMEPDIVERIFDPYFTTKEIDEGTGMGLSVVHGIVKNHGGAIRVYSEPGKGTTFNVFLPVLESETVPEC